MRITKIKGKRRFELEAAVRENDGYCPCKLEQTDDTKCMCLEFRTQTEPGECHCGLYILVEE